MEQLNAFLTSYKIPLVVCLVGVILIVGGLVNHPSSKPKTNFPTASLVKTTEAAGDLKVNVSGAVKTPGVYALSTGDRVEDAIKAAGGFTADANTSYISKVVNLSQKVSDGLKIYIPFANENAPAVAGVASVSTSPGVIGLNSATQAQLESLTGVGPATAAKIINGRPYADPHDLVSKKILSAKVYAQIQSQVDIN